MGSTEIYDAVREHYSAASKGSGSGVYESKVAKAFGYSDEELLSIPKDSNLGLSCGNPLAVANVKEGETVVDLGSGAGFDIFLASKKVGENGRAIGIDMNKDMLAKANRNKEQVNATNVEFIEAPITNIAPLPNNSVDCVISNCVINLVPEVEKQFVFNEMARILKPGGRVAISDILLKSELPPELQSNMALYVGCIAGASKVEGYKTYLKHANFQDVLIVDGEKDLNVYNSNVDDATSSVPCCGAKVETQPCCAPKTETKSSSGGKQKNGCCGANEEVQPNSELTKIDFNVYAGSYHILAVKP